MHSGEGCIFSPRGVSHVRYGSRTPSAEDIALADEWALEAGDRMLASVFKEFGAVDLMVSQGGHTSGHLN